MLEARATDSRGNVQPDTVPLNELGYPFGVIVDHPVTVVWSRRVANVGRTRLC